MADANTDALMIKMVIHYVSDIHNSAYIMFNDDEETIRLYLQLLGNALIKLSEGADEDE